MTMERNSARVIATQAPSPPIIRGSSKSPTAMKTKVRMKEIIAETLPLEKAVNRAEVKILRPEKRKLMLKIAKPPRAML